MNAVLTTAKAWAALIGAIVTAVLGTVPEHDTTWTVLTIVAAVCTAIATYAIPNAAKRDKSGRFE